MNSFLKMVLATLLAFIFLVVGKSSAQYDSWDSADEDATVPTDMQRQIDAVNASHKKFYEENRPVTMPSVARQDEGRTGGNSWNIPPVEERAAIASHAQTPDSAHPRAMVRPPAPETYEEPVMRQDEGRTGGNSWNIRPVEVRPRTMVRPPAPEVFEEPAMRHEDCAVGGDVRSIPQREVRSVRSR